MQYLTKIEIFFLSIQTAHSMATLRHHLRRTGDRQLGRHGLLNCHSVHDAVVRGERDRLFPLENEQRTGFHHVLALLCICRRIADVWVQVPRVSLLIFAKPLRFPYNHMDLGLCIYIYIHIYSYILQTNQHQIAIMDNCASASVCVYAQQTPTHAQTHRKIYDNKSTTIHTTTNAINEV